MRLFCRRPHVRQGASAAKINNYFRTVMVELRARQYYFWLGADG
jgi:hypothetical protein